MSLISPQWRKSYGTHTKFQLEQVLHELLCKRAVLIHLTSGEENIVKGIMIFTEVKMMFVVLL